MEKIMQNMFEKIISKIDHLEEILTEERIKNEGLLKNVESNARHIHKCEGSLLSLDKMIDINKENILLIENRLIDINKSLDDISSGFSDISARIKDIEKYGSINWIKTIAKYIPYILIFGAISLFLADSPLRHLMKH